MKEPEAGLNPTSPVMIDVGTFVIDVPARIAKLAAAPRSVAVAALADPARPKTATAIIANSEILPNVFIEN
jgi:hypothetical protein